MRFVPCTVWALSVQAGLLDRRVLDQLSIWVTAQALIMHVPEMSTEHLEAVVGMLTWRAGELHAAAILDTLASDVLARLCGETTGEGLMRELARPGIGDLDPLVWLETTALVRALRRELQRRAVR